MNRIILIGMPCSFKSSVGRRLSRLLQLPHIDTDIELENSTGMTISQLMDRGEQYFRSQEQLIISALPHTPCVISTGGGVIEQSANMIQLSQHSTIVWLSATTATIYHRLSNSNNPRPLTMHLDIDQLEAVVSRRNKIYAQYADITIATDNTTSHALATRLASMLTTK